MKSFPVCIGNGDQGNTSARGVAFGGGGAGGRIRMSFNPSSKVVAFKGNYSTMGGLSKYEDYDPVEDGIWDVAVDQIDFQKVVRAPSGKYSSTQH